MSISPSAPGPADWLAGLLRAAHPVRWLLGAVGLAATALTFAAARALFEGAPPDWAGWWLRPAEQAQALGAALAGRSLAGAAVRGGALLAVTAMAWGLVGGWIARHELLARRRGDPDWSDRTLAPGATALVTGWGKSLVAGFLTPLVLCLLALVPVLIAGRANAWMGGPGAVLVAVFLPVVLLADLVLLVMALGVLAWPLMPVTVAAETSDVFDALSRSYSYLYQRPVRFVILTAVALGLAGLPLAIVLDPLAGPLAAWPPDARRAVVWAAAALSASVFWTLQTRVYLDLRTAVDAVDAGELAVEPAPAGGEKPPSAKPAAPPKSGAEPAGTGSVATQAVPLFALLFGAWCLTAWLFEWGGGERATWLNWGLGETFAPPAEGLYRFASWVAAFWGVVWLGFPLLRAVRHLVRGEPPDVGNTPKPLPPGGRPA